MNRLLKSKIKNALALTILSGGLINGLTAEKADAAILVSGLETGGNVTFTLSGSLDVSDIENVNILSGLYFQGTRILPQRGTIAFNPNEPVDIPNLDVYVNLIDNPSNLSFGSGMRTNPDTKSGDPVVFDLIFRGADQQVSRSRVRLPQGYMTGTELSSTMTFNNTDFDTLGIESGTYFSGFNGGADTITFEFGNDPIDPEPVPEPVTILGTMTALGFGSFIKKKRKQQNS